MSMCRYPIIMNMDLLLYFVGKELASESDSEEIQSPWNSEVLFLIVMI